MRVAVCCREGLFCDALSSLLDNHGNFQVVACESTARQLVMAAKDQRAQLLVVDSVGLEPNDLQFLLGARAFGDFAVVLLAPEEQIQKNSGLAVDRVISRTGPSSDLFDALSELGANLRVTYPYVRERKRPYGRVGGTDLSRREYEVAQLVSRGMSNRKIAQVTGLREQSIKNLVSVIMRKLQCENRVQVALRLTQNPVYSELEAKEKQSNEA